MKKLINAPADVLADALRGMAAAEPSLRLDLAQRLIYRATPKPAGRVALVSGGGSGHEPLHGGYVGFGMLDVACCGEIFTSPTPDQVLAASLAVERGAGVLHIVKNYSGDVMNFEMAAELAREEGPIGLAAVIVQDDVAVEDSLYTSGRRGVGLTVLLEKIVGAAAEEGRSLADLVALAEQVSARGRSIGVALSSCTVPGVGRPTFELPEDQMELGIGIHGEPGRQQVRLAPASEIAAMLVEPLLLERDATTDPAIVMLNGMGATPLLELYLMVGEVMSILERKGVRVARTLVGNMITALDMAGCSLTLLSVDEAMLKLWDAPVQTPALRWGR